MGVSRCSRWTVFTFALIMLPAMLSAGVFISVGFAPPLLPVYSQPPCPAAGYIWTPGYWAYSNDGGYYWVPGTWVLAPQPGYLWTPGYWGWGSNAYLWHPGYWGPQVGFYGGVNYGYGYNGYGYEGGYWRGSQFYYNRTVNNVHIANVNVYNKTVVNNVTVNRVSYNGGNGGITARPTAAQEAAARDRHIEATNLQVQHEQAARQDRSMLASVNHGQPAVAATSRPGAFHGSGVEAARNAPVNSLATTPRANQQRANEYNASRPNSPNANARLENNVPRPPARENNAPAEPREVPRPPAAHNSQPEGYHSTPAARSSQPAESSRPAEPPHATQMERPAAPEARPMQSQPAPHVSEPQRAEPAHPPAPSAHEVPHGEEQR